MRFFHDILPILNKRELSFLERYKESENVYTFIFEKENALNWKAGQHGVFTITHKDIKKPTRPFSIASSPTENIVKITMEIGDAPSEFKRAMLELKQGMKLRMRGPIGPMYINDLSPTLLIAGGIGITPFRAILKDLVNSGNASASQVTLLYIDREGSFIFRDELDEITKNTRIKINYLYSRGDLYQNIDMFILEHHNIGKYFIAGSKLMVDAVADYLKRNHIAKRNIKKDAFIGYK